MKPCSSCPFQPDAPRGLWHPAHYLLIAYLGSVRDFVDPGTLFRSMGCHKFNGIVGKNPAGPPPRCGGWVRAAHDSLKVTLDRRAGRTEDDDDTTTAVLSPEEMAYYNGLDVERLPPLSFDPRGTRYATYNDWQAAHIELRAKLEADPEYAREFVVPGSPLDIGISDEAVRAALGDNAADRYGRRAE